MAALHQAERLARATGADVTFVQAELHRALEVLPAAAFDLVYTRLGALCWLPDVHRWAKVVAALLRPGGRLFLREGHPVLWSLDEKRVDALVIGYPYFEHEAPLVFLVLTQLVEHDSVPWNALPGQMSHLENGKWRVTDRPERLPHTYTLQARKP